MGLESRNRGLIDRRWLYATAYDRLVRAVISARFLFIQERPCPRSPPSLPQGRERGSPAQRSAAIRAFASLLASSEFLQSDWVWIASSHLACGPSIVVVDRTRKRGSTASRERHLDNDCKMCGVCHIYHTNRRLTPCGHPGSPVQLAEPRRPRSICALSNALSKASGGGGTPAVLQ